MFFLCGILVKAKVKQLREETAPVIARFMEAEVLRSQIQAQNVELLNGGLGGLGIGRWLSAGLQWGFGEIEAGSGCL